MLETSLHRAESPAHDLLRPLIQPQFDRENNTHVARMKAAGDLSTLTRLFDASNPFLLVRGDGKEPKSDQSERIDKLISQMGSSNFGKREAASKALIEEGRDALPALHKAMSHTDAEIRRRAKNAFETVLWQPSTFTHKQSDVPLSRVLRELSKQTGHEVELGNLLDDPKISVDFKKQGFWQALDEICKKTGSHFERQKDGTFKIQSGAIPEGTIILYDGAMRAEITETRTFERVPGRGGFPVARGIETWLSATLSYEGPNDLKLGTNCASAFAKTADGNPIVDWGGPVADTTVWAPRLDTEANTAKFTVVLRHGPKQSLELKDVNFILPLKTDFGGKTYENTWSFTVPKLKTKDLGLSPQDR